MIIYDYVRTKDGYIGNVNNTDDENIFENHNLILGKNLLIGKIVKSKPNIIGLIEEGDYVNGRKVEWVGDNFVAFGRLDYAYEKDIKSIVTKEQFESMEYKIESEGN